MDHYHYVSSSKQCSSEDYYSKCSEIRSAVDEKDIERLKLLLDSAEWYTMELDHQKILQYVVLQRNKEVFDFLLSIEAFPLDATTDKFPTALTLSLQQPCMPLNGYFASELIKKGANVHIVGQKGITLLHQVVLTPFTEVCQLLIERGLDVNAQTVHGETPLRYFCNNHEKIRDDFKSKILPLLLFYGADVYPVDDPSLGTDLFKISLTFLYDVGPVQEILFNYTVDQYLNKLEISIFDLLQFAYYSKSHSLVCEIIEHTTELIIEINDEPCLSYLFWIDSFILKKLINKFGDVIKILLISNYSVRSPLNSQSIENFEILLNSELASATVEYIGTLNVIKTIDLFDEDLQLSSLTDLLYYLVSYGMPVLELDLQFVFKAFGYCDLFKILLHMDIQKTEDVQLDIMPAIIYDVHMSLEKFLEDPHNYSLNAIDQLLHFFSDQNLKDLCYSLKVGRLVAKARQLPRVPLLVELSRNVFRTFLINKYQITTSKQFYTILNWLPINAYYKKIIAFEVPLY